MRKFQTWLARWIMLMALWLMIDDSLRADELLAGAGAAALAALLAAAVGGETWGKLRPSVRAIAALPGQVVRDTFTVFAALARRLATGELPRGGYAEVPVSYGDDRSGIAARRVLLTWSRSLAPGTFVVDVADDRDVMIVHHLAVSAPEAEQAP